MNRQTLLSKAACKIPIKMTSNKEAVKFFSPEGIDIFAPSEVKSAGLLIGKVHKRGAFPIAESPVLGLERFFTSRNPKRGEELYRRLESYLRANDPEFTPHFFDKVSLITWAARANVHIKALSKNYDVYAKTVRGDLVQIGNLNETELLHFLIARSQTSKNQRGLLETALESARENPYALNILFARQGFTHRVLTDKNGLALDFSPPTKTLLDNVEVAIQALKSNPQRGQLYAERLAHLEAEKVRIQQALDTVDKNLKDQLAREDPAVDFETLAEAKKQELRDQAIAGMHTHLLGQNPRHSVIDVPLTRSRKEDEIATIYALVNRFYSPNKPGDVPEFISHLTPQSSRKEVLAVIDKLKIDGFVFHHAAKVAIGPDRILRGEMQIITKNAHFQYLKNAFHEEPRLFINTDGELTYDTFLTRISGNGLQHVGGALIYRLYYMITGKYK